MRITGIRLCLSLSLCLCAACSHTPDHQGKTPLVETKGRFLYREDLQAALPAGLTTDDSLLFADRYVRRWIEETLLYEKAKENIPDNAAIERQVENYRRTLILHTYRQALIHQKLADNVGEEEVEAYYHSHAGLFRVESPLVKGLFIKVPLKAPQLSEVRRWYKSDSHEAVEHLEKYSLRNAVKYEYFYDKWRPVSEVFAWMPRQEGITAENRLQGNRHIELQDTAFHYFLHITDYRAAGEEEPYEIARVRARELLLNERQAAFLKQADEDLYREAIENDEVKYYQ